MEKLNMRQIAVALLVAGCITSGCGGDIAASISIGDAGAETIAPLDAAAETAATIDAPLACVVDGAIVLGTIGDCLAPGPCTAIVACVDQGHDGPFCEATGICE